MSKIKITPQQLSALKALVNNKKEWLQSNDNYKLDFVKFMFHPETPNFIVLKMRVHGISSGMPFDEITYDFVDENGTQVPYKNKFLSIPAWFQFTSEMREISIVNGEAVMVN
jgi:hypothetical protein